MVDTAFSVAVKAAECLVAVGPPIAQLFSYLWNYETHFDKLDTELRKLKGQRDKVQHSVEEARRNGEQIEQLVNNWLDRVHTIIAEVSKVIEENERADMICFMGLCPNPKKRYQHSSKAVEKTEVVAGLYDEGNFPTVSFRTIPEETWIPSYKGYMVFKSRMSTLTNILDALGNPDVNMVGIYGTGGIGKTMLAKEIAQHADDKKRFNVVAFAEVAVKPDIKEIQQEIADKLGLTFREESISGRARSLRQRLKQEEKVLLVLDNIWDKLDLEDVGIPFGNDGEGCKLLLTARILDVLLEMESQNNFEVGILDEGEAWSLYEKKTGVCDHLQALAKDVALACGGLPIAIDSVAVALKNKEECEWKDALRKLTVPSTNLLAYGVGLGIFEKVDAIKDARNRVNTLLRKLKDSSLLLDIKNYRFSLHDVVRDVGTSIASRDWNMFRNCTIRELVDKDALKNCLAITLQNISELPKEFECPELQFFYLSTTAVDNCRFPDSFFIGMPKLKVLHLVGFDLNSMPKSIGLLVNLRTLYIDDCKLRDIDFIGEFKQLEILRIYDYYNSEIEMIPKKMCNLTRLRLLDLDDCGCLRNIPPNVLSTFIQLEELYLPASVITSVIRECKIEWVVGGVNILNELKHLTLLTALDISIPDANVLPKGQLLSNKLERYRITFGRNVRSEFYRLRETSRRTVKLNLVSSSCSDDVQKFLSVLDTEGFPELEYLWVENSPCFLTVVDCLESESCHNHFLFLEWLNLRSVFNLERIHNHQLGAESFQRLTTLEVVKCNKLKNIFSFSTYRALPLLQQVYVSSCDNMEEIFAINRWEEDINNDEGTDQIEFKQLRSLRLNSLPKLTSFCSINGNKDMLDQIEFKQLHSLRLDSLPKLTSFCSINGNKDILDTPTLLFNQKVAFPSLEEISISAMLDLEMIWPNQLCKDSFCNLKSLKVTKCNKLTTIFQSNMIERITKLESLTICNCDLVEEIFDLQGVYFEEPHSQIETRLRELDINGLPKLKHIWNKDQQMSSFQQLSSVVVHHCMSLKYLFPVSIAESLSELEKLSVCYCEVLEEIVADDHEEAKVADTIVFPRVTSLELKYLPRLKTFYHKLSSFSLLCKDLFCNLKSLEVRKCNKLLTIFQSNMLERIARLESLTISDCDLVEEIFDLQEVDFEESLPAKEALLRELVINGLPKLKHIWNKDPQIMFSYQKLSSVKVYDCMSLKYLFPLSIAESLSELEKLHVHDCEVLEEIVGDDHEESKVADTFVFQRVTSLELKYLPRLKTLYRGVHTSQWQNLKRLVMCGCDKVELFASELFNFQENNEGQHDSSLQPLFMVEKVTFPSLEEIKISKSNNLKMVWHKRAKESFFNLKSMEVSNCNSLLTIFQFSMPRLLTVGVSGCALVEENFDLQKVNFEKLNIRGLPKLKHIWKKDPQAKLSFEELPMPKSLTVSNCDSIEVIFDLQKVNFEESHSRAVTNQLKMLYISWLPKLKHIWKKDPQAKLSFEELPKLESLTVSYCDSIEEIFDLQNVNFEESHSGAITQQLQELCIDELPKLKHIWNKDPQAQLFFKSQRKLEVYNCQNLKDVENCGQVEEIVAKEGEAKAAVRFVFPEVTSIKLNNLPQLRTFYPGVHSSKWLVLKELKVVGCDKIELLASELFSSQENNEESHLEIPAQQPLFLVEKDSFQNLTFLRVWHCNGLKNLMTSSTAKSLVQLREMEIEYCKSMVEVVVAKEGDVIEEDEITISKLRTLTLRDLPSLSCFGSENCTFKLPSLEVLNLHSCPRMKCFSSRDVTTPILQIVKKHWGDRRVYKVKGDLNTTIQQIQEDLSNNENLSHDSSATRNHNSSTCHKKNKDFLAALAKTLSLNRTLKLDQSNHV
ncbi:hypothetical protein EZV62_007014 [Acer yangbiense]|uniref:AAA+ ATPase domain-containing protein n=1 Tax=Acer yangbiense TaxID=1000413 RepID=A0A5C7IAH1_9ROSI|nr:hypothetical protein EZV62_007014 [Acer yangbiense]